MRKYGIIIQMFLISTVCLQSSRIAYGQNSSFTAPIPHSYQEHWLFLELSDTVNGVWNHITPLQLPLLGVVSYFWENNNKVFLCGGIDSMGNRQNTCYFYDVSANSYEAGDTMLSPRYFGKLVRVKDSLYLVGSVGSNFFVPDGAMYKYTPASNEWVSRAPVPAPLVHEMAVCVWNDSLIIAIGGSTNAFGGATNIVKVYNPYSNTWRVLSGTTNSFPVNITSAHAECIGDEIVVLGGYNSNPINKIYYGHIDSSSIDNLNWVEDTLATPFGTGVYRAGGGKFGSIMVFGPALSSNACLNQFWGFNTYNNQWIRFFPNSLDSAANRTTIAVKHTADSLHFFLFGGMTWDSATHVINTCEKFSTGNPVIGISGTGNFIPKEFVLYPNYPNPFNPSTKIVFAIPKAGIVKISVFNVLGETVKIVSENLFSAGKHEVEFNGSELSSGVYFYRLQYNNTIENGKMILLK